MGDCKHDCKQPARFPKNLFNRPGLDQIDYRIGTYSRLREYLFDQLDQSQTLSGWTYRGADDPGIALLEGTAVVGDILSFYQQLYANEAFLRTADWRESIKDLVQLTGYRLAPGVGGEAVFAAQIKGDQPVTIPAGFGFKAKLDGREQPDEFESRKTVKAWPHLSRFSLYRPADAPQTIQAADTHSTHKHNQLELFNAGGKSGLAARLAVGLEPGDRVMLVPDSSMFDAVSSYSDQDEPEILIVKSVETVLDRIILTFEGELQVNRNVTVRAFKIGRTFRHFGHNALRKLTTYDGTEVTIQNTDFDRNIHETHDDDTANYSALDSRDMPLDEEVDDLALGSSLICEGLASEFSDSFSGTNYNNRRFVVVKTVESVRVDNLYWANLEASTSVVRLDGELFTNTFLEDEKADIRRLRFHETLSPELLLVAPAVFSDGEFSNTTLKYFGTYDEAVALADRELLLVDETAGRVQSVRVESTVDDFNNLLTGRDTEHDWTWTVLLNQPPVFNRQAFDQREPKITVFGNPVHTDQGKSQDETVLGSGDRRTTFQTFAIPKTPLTYHLDETQTPAQVPALEVYVDGIRWQRVDTLFGRGPDEPVYVVREDDDGNSYVQFGDGMTGARLPSGRNNVVAVFRTGVAAAGLLEDGKKAQASGRLPALDKVFLPGEVVGGDEAESGATARETAPGRMQSLGRLVGLADYEAEARHLPGVLKVRAEWIALNGTPRVAVWVLTESGTSAAVTKLQKTLNRYNRCRGPARYPIQVRQGLRQYLYLNLKAAFDPARRRADIKSAIEAELGLVTEDGKPADNGLFSLKTRHFGRGAHRSQVLAAVQQVDGVRWVEVIDAQPLDLGDPPATDPDTLTKPTALSTEKVIACPAGRILVLAPEHFDLTLVEDSFERECDT